MGGGGKRPSHQKLKGQPGIAWLPHLRTVNNLKNFVTVAGGECDSRYLPEHINNNQFPPINLKPIERKLFSEFEKPVKLCF